MRAESDAANGFRDRLPRLLSIAAVLLLVGLLAFGLIAKGTGDAIDRELADGHAPLAPAFELPVLEPGVLPGALGEDVAPALADGRLSLGELRGTPFVLNFWASWCIPCREEAPLLERSWREHGPRGVLFLGLNMQDLTDDARAFLREFDIGYPTIREPANEVARSYGTTGIPETFFVSARGRVVGHVIGVVTPEQLDASIAAARRGEVVGTLAGGARKPQR